jgi:hypothetical protein
MKRDYSTGEATAVDFFVGVEIEKTPAYGLKTLFVTGIHTVEKIIELYNEHSCSHIFLGANQSYNYSLDKWNQMITGVLDYEILVTLDFDIDKLSWIKNQPWFNRENFIPQISFKIPNIKNLNKNTMLKLDDIDFKATNPGVWCHKLSDLQTDETFTGWEEYKGDTPL